MVDGTSGEDDGVSVGTQKSLTDVECPDENVSIFGLEVTSSFLVDHRCLLGFLAPKRRDTPLGQNRRFGPRRGWT